MPFPKISSSRQTPCEQCPLRQMPTFRDFTPEELDFVSSFKTGELTLNAGTTVLSEGAQSAHLFTVLSGWAFRYKMLDDGRRQILNFAMPGDLIGLQATLMAEMQHSVEALSSMTLCVFERERLGQVYREQPDLAFDITWIAAQEERILDEHLLSIGRRTAMERAAYLLAFLAQRGRASGLFRDQPIVVPLTQQHVADTLGLSIVHTNKTLKKLAERGLLRWGERGCEIMDESGLLRVAGWDGLTESKRRFV
ncbi:Crp/Fnr family transcriptional regulator [Xaviernesmea oryzae]|uniref:Crp/Fnr family transcriptional regulator n=1 Tax=Xaviernesmea oryzae TaxID=464029 RepID=A0A1Q9B2Y9_9HYPH|nr:Crp/Fnr family transcriptional regulator [Xaviernesmea oryzae]OLP62369.1 Crp/Fnr family transcriptional regulator [Xaviernesmea oryzae]SEL98394.1 cAMP-binding domain of CRP or a regulatory subunit of cAMP-dependent protein kinases [Xaviernesmea oryzae]